MSELEERESGGVVGCLGGEDLVEDVRLVVLEPEFDGPSLRSSWGMPSQPELSAFVRQPRLWPTS